MLVIAGSIRLDPSKIEEARAAALVMMRETHKEPGNRAYVFSLDLAEDGLVHIFEHWDSQEALDAHFAAPHMATFQKTVGGLGVKEMNIQKYEVSSVGPLR